MENESKRLISPSNNEVLEWLLQNIRPYETFDIVDKLKSFNWSPADNIILDFRINEIYRQLLHEGFIINDKQAPEPLDTSRKQK